MPLTAELIAVGTELLLGQIANTDAQIVSQALSELGIHVYFHTVVGDNPGRLRSAFEIAAARADIIITTGGLGPTADDITKEVAAEVFECPLVFHEPAWEAIASWFTKAGRTVTENNKRQAYLPKGAEILTNDWGTAPGCALFTQGKHIIMLPGPPRECAAMLANRAVPYLARLSDGVLRSRIIRVFGMGESVMESKLQHFMASANPTLAPYAGEGECFLRVTARGKDDAEALALTQPLVDQVLAILGPAVYGVDTGSLEETVVRLLSARKLTVAMAESCTGGWVGQRLTNIPGSSACYLGGVCAYTPELKTRLLGVPSETLERYGAVSAETAMAMAEGIRSRTGADIAAAVTGIAGPAGDGSAAEAGTVYIALASSRGSEAKCLRLGENRYRVRLMASGHVLDTVRHHILTAFGPERPDIE
jgi:nicotinamide-nucleotide amidase